MSGRLFGEPVIERFVKPMDINDTGLKIATRLTYKDRGSIRLCGFPLRISLVRIHLLILALSDVFTYEVRKEVTRKKEKKCLGS